MMQDDVYDEKINLVRFASVRKKFLDSLQISVPDSVYTQYLELHSFPQEMREALLVKQRILRVEQKKIHKIITKDSVRCKRQLTSFSKNFKQF